MTCELCGHRLRRTNKYGVCNTTRECQSLYMKRWRDPLHPGKTLAEVESAEHYEVFHRIRERARSKGIPFTITKYDIFPVPSHCPVLGIPLKRKVGSKGPQYNSPSLDRISPGLGYVPGNVQWISYKANTMKSNATPDELRRFAEWVLSTVS